MSVQFTSASEQSRETPPVRENEFTITSRRETEPFLEKARQILAHYREAANCSTVLLDRTGFRVSINDSKEQTGLCEFCKKYKNHHGLNFKKARLLEAAEYPCVSSPVEVLSESRRTGETRIFACELGCIYWTSPLFRNGHYTGALIAGQVLPGRRKEAAEKILFFCKDRIAAGKFAAFLENLSEKNSREIKALARLLEVCANKLSERQDNFGGIIRRYAPGNENGAKPNSRPKTCRKADENNGNIPEARENLLDKERALLAAFRRGDRETGGRILDELMENIRAASFDNFENIRFRAIELVVLLSRAPAPGTPGNNLLESNNRYLKRIEESKTVEELTCNVKCAAEGLAGSIFSFMGIRHASVLIKAERYIWENYTRKISLEEIAKSAGLSAPYFSTTFKEEMGENFTGYLNRLRIERAAVLLSETEKSLKEIAKLSGFEDQSWFSKTFKNYTGMSPGKYREQGCGTPLRTCGKNYINEVNFPNSNAPSEEGRDILSS